MWLGKKRARREIGRGNGGKNFARGISEARSKENKHSRRRGGSGQYKNYGGNERTHFRVAARQGALDQAQASVMAARSGVLGGVVLRRRVVGVAMGRTHTAAAAVYRVGLPCRSPQGGPEEDGGEQAHPCAKFLSRSDRKLARDRHWLREKYYINSCRGGQSGFSGWGTPQPAGFPANPPPSRRIAN